MMIWRGLGILVPVVALATMASTQLLIDSVMSDGYYTAHGWPKLMACTFTAIALLGIGLIINRPTGPSSAAEDTAAQTHKRQNHTFFFIPIQYWSAIVLLLGIAMLALS